MEALSGSASSQSLLAWLPFLWSKVLFPGGVFVGEDVYERMIDSTYHMGVPQFEQVNYRLLDAAQCGLRNKIVPFQITQNRRLSCWKFTSRCCDYRRFGR